MHPTVVKTTKYGTILLPNEHVSYSALDKWDKDKPGFRKRYYEGIKDPDTIFTLFGRETHAIVDTDQRFRDIRLPVSEHRLKFLVSGIPVLGYVDTFNDKYYRNKKYLFGEYKTGIRNKEGKAPWTQSAVMKHKQLAFYSLGLQITLHHGVKRHPCYLVWLETERKIQQQKVGNVILSSKDALVLTGHSEKFERTIYEFERKMIRQWIIKNALEISDDYKKWRKERGLLEM